MIIGHIANAETEYSFYEPKLARGIQYLAATDFVDMAEGRYELGDGMFALVQEYVTEPKNKRRAESHAKYIDIQFVVQGEENVGYAVLNNDCIVEENLLAEKDVIFYSEVVAEADFALLTGMFAVFYPWDVHRPSVARNEPTRVKKVVVKIPM